MQPAPKLFSVQHQPFTPPQGKQPWHFTSAGLDTNLSKGSKYKLVAAGKDDFEKARQFYLRCPVGGYDIGSVDIIHNPTILRNFESTVEMLNERAGNPAFKAKWIDEKNHVELRTDVYRLYKKIAEPYKANSCSAVKLLPMWHGTSENVIESLCQTGFANLALTDSGYFGKGIYSAYEAEYSWRVYSKGGILVLLWNACFSAYPAVDGDMKNLKGKANYGNHDAHFIPVVPENPLDSNPMCYIPCKKNQKHKYVELVVFNNSACLPRYIVKLQSNLKKELKQPAQLISSANTNPMESQYQKGKKLYLQKNYDAALFEFRELVTLKFDKGQYMMGICYYYGNGVKINYQKALDYFQLAADQKHPNALYMLGICVKGGFGCTKDLALAKQYFESAAKHGSQDAKKALEATLK